MVYLELEYERGNKDRKQTIAVAARRTHESRAARASGIRLKLHSQKVRNSYLH